MNQRLVERLSLVDGVVVATGRCDPDETPQLVHDGVALTDQACRRHERTDTAGANGGRPLLSGFRLAAIVDPKDIPDNSKLAVRFSDGALMRRSPPNASDAHRILNEFAEEVAANPGSSMIEIGSRARSGTIYRTRFPLLGKYVGLDVTDGPNVDLVADAHTMSTVIHDRFDYGLSISTFEHLMMPWVVAYELGRVMKPGGTIYVQSHPTFPLHDTPWDFFRFSCEAWKGLFNRFTGFEVLQTGYSLDASIIPLNAHGGPLQTMDRSRTFLVSACTARKIGEPTVDWSCDPSAIANLQYSHGAGKVRE